MSETLENQTIIEKIKGFVSERVNKPLKTGVDVTAIIKKLKERNAKKDKK